ncbi:MAG: adenosine deaminase, partial [Caulobacterales bacterium]|nr:adenosine deaminase [Caulobacterales bacterium]
MKRMLDLRLRATVNSDDPAYFGGYLVDNYAAVAAATGLGVAEIATLARHSFTGSFLAPEEQAPHLADIDRLEEAARAA